VLLAAELAADDALDAVDDEALEAPPVEDPLDVDVLDDALDDDPPAPELLDELEAVVELVPPMPPMFCGPKKASATLVVPRVGVTSTPTIATLVPMALSNVPST